LQSVGTCFPLHGFTGERVSHCMDLGEHMEIAAIIAVICAYIVKGMCGYANTLVFSTIMSFTTNNINISPLELIVGYPSNILIAWKERKAVSAKVCVPLSILVMQTHWCLVR